MAKCMYKSESEGTCCRSTSEHHCEQVTDAICSKCILQQGEPIVSDKVKFKNIIRKGLELLPETKENFQAIKLFKDALKI